MQDVAIDNVVYNLKGPMEITLGDNYVVYSENGELRIVSWEKIREENRKFYGDVPPKADKEG